MNLFTSNVNALNGSEVCQRTKEDLTSTLKLNFVEIYAVFCEKGLLRLNLHHPEHIGKDLRKFGSAKYL